jgi:hypothetical protein
LPGYATAADERAPHREPPRRAPRPGPAAGASARRDRTAAWTATGPAASIAFDPPPPRARDDDDTIARPFDVSIPGRVVLALIAWPPIGFALGAVLNEVTGCGRFSAVCEDPAPLLPWLIQPLIVAILLALPIVARPAAVASVAVGIAALGGGVVLSAIGGPRAQLHGVPTLLLAVLVMAYAVGLLGGVSGKIPLPRWLDRSD